MRYQLYREHKFVSAALNDVERLIAQTDFCDVHALYAARKAFDGVAQMLTMHARYEDERIHELLRIKNSHVFTHVEQEHTQQHEALNLIATMFDDLEQKQDRQQKIEDGHALYLAYRKFVADILVHLHEEETVILPELQRLYSDEQLHQVEAIAYREMTADDMFHMVQGLFPYMNRHDRFLFLQTMYLLEPKKFLIAWQKIAEMLTDAERFDMNTEITRVKL